MPVRKWRNDADTVAGQPIKASIALRIGLNANSLAHGSSRL